jgi:hypothetical protein
VSYGVGSNQYYKRSAIPAQPSPPSLVEQLSGSIRQRARTVNFLDAPDRLVDATNDPSFRVRYRVARNKASTPEVLHRLSRDSDPSVQYAAAMHPALTSADAEELARHTGIDQIMGRLAERSNLTDLAVQYITGQLERYLATNPSPPTRSDLPAGQKPDMTYYWAVRSAQKLAANPYLSEAGLQLVLDITQKHRGQLRIPMRELTSVDHPNMTLAQQRQLVYLIDTHYQGDWLHNSRWQQQLPADGVVHLLQRHRIPQLLRQRSLSWDRAVQLAAPRTSPNANDDLAELLARPDCPPEFMRQNTNCEGWAAHNLVRHPKVPRDVLEQLSKHPDNQIRRQTAGNRRTPIDTLEQLLRDPETKVRTAAAQNPSLPAATRAMWQLTR